MEYVTLANDIAIPMIGFGPGISGYSAKYQEPKNAISSFVRRAFNKVIRRPLQHQHYVKSVVSAIQNGFRLIDYSAAYGDGSLIGKAIKKAGVKRENLILTTRVSNRAQIAGGEYIEKEFHSQLKGLGTDYIDILMFHWPVTGYYEKTWLKMVELYQQGYCRILGVANCHSHHLETLASLSDVMPGINQIEVHPLFTQKNLLSFCKERNIQVESYAPIARFDDRLMRLPLLNNLAKKYSKTVPQIILRWHIQCGLIPVIRSLTSRHQQENIDIFNFQLTDEEMARIDGVNINARIRYDPDNCDFSIL